jgi:hypothetical protein
MGNQSRAFSDTRVSLHRRVSCIILLTVTFVLLPISAVNVPKRIRPARTVNL